MTDRDGPHARWSVAALIAPASAALFAGSLAWTQANPPVVLKSVTASASPPSSTEDPVDAEVQRQVQAVTRLRRQVNSLRTEVRQLRAADDATVGARPRRKSSTSSGGSDPASGSKAAAPTTNPKPRATRPAANPPPVVDTTTGAS